MVTIAGLQMTFLLGGTVILESIFGLPGMGRELIQAIRRILLTGKYVSSAAPKPLTLRDQIIADVDSEQITADDLVSSYCKLLYQRHGTYEAVGRIANLDRRTVKKHLQDHDRTKN